MIVEIIGTQFINKGAELMLLAIMDEFKKRKVDVTFCMEPNKYFSPYEKLAPLNIHMKLPYNKKGINFRWTSKFIHTNLKKSYGLIADQDIDIFLDASGFLYSEQWGENSARKLATSIKKWKEQGSKVIILPQAFGPFKSKQIIKNMKDIIDNADLIFAREKQSYEYLCSIDGKKENITIAPDFTNLLEVNTLKIDSRNYENKICIIPNKRMLDKTSKGEEYIKTLSNMIKILDNNQKEYFFLIHEGKPDEEIVNKLNLSNKPTLISTDDALEIKYIIGHSKGVIGSRFHGLVSSLAQGKPVIAIGWSHKYFELLNDYNCSKYFFSFENTKIDECMSLFLDDKIYEEVSNNIKSKSKELKEYSKIMWNKVFNTMDLR